VHEYNGKYIVNFEGGPMEQSYKFDKETTSLEELKKAIQEQSSEVKLRHDDMYAIFKKLFSASRK
jgi:hypothetical protein